MTETETTAMTPLAFLFREANVRARYVSSYSDDGGTCNFDTVYIPKSKANKDALTAAGVRFSNGYGIAKGRLMVHFDTVGQGNKNTNGMKAALNLLREVGIDAHMYYAMD